VWVIGYQQGRAMARLDSLLFGKEIVPTVPVPPPEFISRVQCGRDSQLYTSLGFQYYQQLVDAIGRQRDLSSVRCLLDWGCGSGRVTGHFLAAANGPKVFGCDMDAEAMAWCQAHLAREAFAIVDPLPPLPYADATFDVVVSIAVLPSFGPPAYELWLPEIRRVLAPEGLFLASVQGRFAAEFELPGDALADLDRLGICDPGLRYNAQSQAPEGADWRGYFLARDYFQRQWSQYFEVVDYLDGEINADQDLVVMRRTA
jgi:SAM-dependent methyltransferase